MSPRFISDDAAEMREACADLVDNDANELFAFAALDVEEAADVLTEIADLRSLAMRIRSVRLPDDDAAPVTPAPLTTEHPAVKRARRDEGARLLFSFETAGERCRDPRVKKAAADLLADLRGRVEQWTADARDLVVEEEVSQ